MYYWEDDYEKINLDELYFERLDTIAENYREIPEVQQIRLYLMMIIVENKLLDPETIPWFKDTKYRLYMENCDQFNAPGYIETLGMFEKIKHLVDPADYYFLYGCTVEGEEDAVAFAKTAKLRPHDFVVQAIHIQFQRTSNWHKKLYRLAQKWPLQGIDQKTINFIKMLRMADDFKRKPYRATVDQIQELINADARYVDFVYSLFYNRCLIHPEPGLLKLAEELSLKHPKAGLIDFARCKFLTAFGKIKESKKIIDGIDIKKLELDHHELLEFLNLKARTYRDCGYIEDSIKMYRDIVFNKKFSKKGSKFYFLALFGLAGIYAEAGQEQEVKLLLKRLPSSEIYHKFKETFVQDYYLFFNYRFIGFKKYAKAVKMLKRSLVFIESEFIREKIKLLERMSVN